MGLLDGILSNVVGSLGSGAVPGGQNPLGALLGGLGGGQGQGANLLTAAMSLLRFAAEIHKLRRPRPTATIPTASAVGPSQLRARLRFGSGGVSCELSVSVALGPSSGWL